MSRVTLTDGALGTEYQKLGLPPGVCADVWNLESPEKVLQVTRAYVDAGSQAVLTTTFRANAVALAEYGRADQARRINTESARLCREAAKGKARVFGSVGPSGKIDYSETELAHAFAEQCEALAYGGVDKIVLETFSDLNEAKIALEAGLNTGLPVIVSFAFDSGKNKDRTMMGVTPEQLAKEMTDAGAFAVGANCGVGFEEYVGICQRLRAATDLPIWIKPNGGLPEIVDGKIAYRTTPEEFARYVPEYIEAGANYIGGCCGTTPEFIRAAAGVLARNLAARA